MTGAKTANASPTVAALVTNYNYARYLPAAIESVERQTHPVSQIVIVDDGSTDDSAHVLAELERRFDQRLTVVRQPNAGQASAINRGATEIRADYVAMLDADDMWSPNKVKRLVATFDQHPSTGMVQHALQLVDGEGTPVPSPAKNARLPSGDLRRLLIATGGANMFEPTSGLAFRRTLLDQIIPIPEKEWRLCADGALAFAAAVLAPVASVTELLGAYRVHGSNSYADIAKPTEELERDLRMTNEYINHWMAVAGVTERVDLTRQLSLQRYRFYTNGGGLREMAHILKLIITWPLYKPSERLWYAARFMTKGLPRLTARWRGARA